MNESRDIRSVQQLVPAEDVAMGISPSVGQRLIPADEQSGSPELLELFPSVEARVEFLEAELLLAEKRGDEAWLQFDIPAWKTATSQYKVILKMLDFERSRNSTGGNCDSPTDRSITNREKTP